MMTSAVISVCASASPALQDNSSDGTDFGDGIERWQRHDRGLRTRQPGEYGFAVPGRPHRASTDRYNVNVPIENPAGRIALAVLDSDYIVDLELTALQARRPRRDRIDTAHHYRQPERGKRIEQGVEIPYQESASSGATTTQFKKAVLSLTVTPQITPDDNIIMDLLVSKDNVGELTPSATGGLVPSIDTRSSRIRRCW